MSWEQTSSTHDCEEAAKHGQIGSLPLAGTGLGWRSSFTQTGARAGAKADAKAGVHEFQHPSTEADIDTLFRPPAALKPGFECKLANPFDTMPPDLWEVR